MTSEDWVTSGSIAKQRDVAPQVNWGGQNTIAQQRDVPTNRAVPVWASEDRITYQRAIIEQQRAAAAARINAIRQKLYSNPIVGRGLAQAEQSIATQRRERQRLEAANRATLSGQNQYANPATESYARTLATADPANAPDQNTFQGVYNAARTDIPDQIRKPVVRGVAQTIRQFPGAGLYIAASDAANKYLGSPKAEEVIAETAVPREAWELAVEFSPLGTVGDVQRAFRAGVPEAQRAVRHAMKVLGDEAGAWKPFFKQHPFAGDDDLLARWDEAANSLRKEAEASGIAWGGRTKPARRGSRQARLQGEVAAFRMQEHMSLERAGLTLGEARQLAREGKVRLTMGRHASDPPTVSPYNSRSFRPWTRFNSETGALGDDVAGKTPEGVLRLSRSSGFSRTPDFVDALEARTVDNPVSSSERVFDGLGAVEVVPGLEANTVHLRSIRTFQKGAGSGSQILDELKRLADETGVRIEGTAVPFGEGGLSKPQLLDFYRRHGFDVDAERVVYSPGATGEPVSRGAKGTAPYPAPSTSSAGVRAGGTPGGSPAVAGTQLPPSPIPKGKVVGHFMDDQGNIVPVTNRKPPPKEIPGRELDYDLSPGPVIRSTPPDPYSPDVPSFYDLDEPAGSFWSRQAEKIDTAIPGRPDIPDIAKQLPEMRQYEAQMLDARQSYQASQERLKVLEQQFAGQGEQRRAFGVAQRTGGITQPPQGMITNDVLREARKDVRASRTRTREAIRNLRELSDVYVAKEDVLQRARAMRAPEELVGAYDQAYDNLTAVTANAKRFTALGERQRNAARLSALVQGNTPDEFVNKVMEARFDLGSALTLNTEAWTRKVLPAVNKVLDADKLGNLSYVGPARMIDHVANHPSQAVVVHPEWFKGFTAEQKAVLDIIDKWQSNRYGLLRSLDRKAASPLDGPYLESIWQAPEGVTLAADRVPRAYGRASVTKKRAWNDPFEAMASDPETWKLKEMSIGEFVEHSARLTDRQIAAQYERKLILQRFGSTTKKSGYRTVDNAAYSGWYLPNDMANWIEQVHAPPEGVARGAKAVTQPVLNTVLGAGLDLAAVGRHTLELTTTQGVPATLGAINRALTVVGRGVDTFGTGLGRKTRLALDGMPVRSGESSFVQPESGTLLKFVPGARKADPALSKAMDAVNRFQYDTVLGEARSFAYEGRLVLAKLFGQDINDPLVRRAAMNETLTFSAGSRGALKESRRALERGFLGAPGITRAMIAQVASLSHLRKPLSPEGLQTIATLANAGFTIYAAAAAASYARTGELPDPRTVFDPRNADWATVHVGGQVQRVNGKAEIVGGRKIPLLPNRGLIRAIGKSMALLEGEDPIRALNAWGQLGYTRLTPAAQSVITLPLGVGFTETGFFRGNLSARDRAIGSLPIPLNVRQSVESALDGELGVSDLILAQLGVTIYPGQTEKQLQEGQKTEVKDKAQKKLATYALDLPDGTTIPGGMEGIPDYVVREVASSPVFEGWDLEGKSYDEAVEYVKEIAAADGVDYRDTDQYKLLDQRPSELRMDARRANPEIDAWYCIVTGSAKPLTQEAADIIKKETGITIKPQEK